MRDYASERMSCIRYNVCMESGLHGLRRVDDAGCIGSNTAAGTDPDIPPLLGPDGKAIIIPIEPVSAQGGKEPRARAAMPTQEAGLVLLPEGAPFVPEWIDEVSPFPFAKKNDRVDCFTHELAYRSGHSAAKVAAKREAGALAALSRMSGLG